VEKITLNKELLERLFGGFSLVRWNDQIRPMEFNQMEKDAHKMFLAFLFGHFEDPHIKIEWDKIIYAGYFELLKKLVLSDIKPAVQRRVAAKADLMSKLNDWVVAQYQGLLDPTMMVEFRKYLEVEDDFDDFNYQILRAAHKYSTLREFEIIKLFNESSVLMMAIEKEIYDDIYPFIHIKGMQMMITKQNLFTFALYYEKLRYQIRWGTTPRIPKTSVMGHSMFVACLMLIFTRQITDSPQRLYNNFFAGLMHDLPESVTRDIISPVKNAVHGLNEMLSDIEKEIVDEDLLGLLDGLDLKREVQILTQEEFTDRTIDESNSEDMMINGKLLKMADHLAAMMEAAFSIRYGVYSPHLWSGVAGAYQRYQDVTEISGVDVRAVTSYMEDLYTEIKTVVSRENISDLNRFNATH